MCLMRKIADVRIKLMSMEIPKSGYNNFGKFNYHELEDLLPIITKECYDRDMFLHFNFTTTEAKLDVVNMDNTQEIVSFVVPMPEIKEMNKKMNIMQSEGSYITYLEKYLLIDAFSITEKSMVELVTPEEEEPKIIQEKPKRNNQITNAKKESKPTGTPKCIGKALQRIASKGVEITPETVQAHVNWRQISDDEKEAAKAYIEAMRGG